MTTFRKLYRDIFVSFGYPLSAQTAIPAARLNAAAKRLNVSIPAALRDYYLIAGAESRFNQCLNSLLPPEEWELDKKRLIFMAENQCVCWWGVSVRNAEADDPPASQGIRDEEFAWYPEHRKCSAFLAGVLHYHAVSAGLPYRGRGDAPEQTGYRFEKNGWTSYGKLKGLLAYSRRNQVVCLMPPGDLPFMQNWSVLAGGKTSADLQTIADELGVELQ